MASRVLLDGKKYLVKWKGWPDDQNSWEPADNVEADEEIKHYEEIRRSKVFMIKQINFQKSTQVGDPKCQRIQNSYFKKNNIENIT